MKQMLLLLSVALLLTFGCGGPDPKSAPEIAWAKDICDFCHMVIEDRRFAAGYRLNTGEQRIFDDIGDMVYALSKESGKVASTWLRNYEADGWLPAEAAFVIESKGIESPMGYGLAAAGTRERADALASQSGGTVLTWQQLLTRGVRPPRAE